MGDVVRILSPARLKTLYDSVLEPSFPPAELESLESLTAKMSDGSAAIRAVESDAAFVATAVTETLLPSAAVLLGYFATRAGRRGQGVGSALLRETIASVVAEDLPPMILAEVEHPDRHGGDEAHGDPSARLRFYGRFGARVLDVPYFQPAIVPESPRVYGMLLLLLWIDPRLVGVGGDRLVENSGIAGALDALLAVEGPIRDTDAAAAALQASARVNGGVRLFSTDDYRLARVS